MIKSMHHQNKIMLNLQFPTHHYTLSSLNNINNRKWTAKMFCPIHLQNELQHVAMGHQVSVEKLYFIISRICAAVLFEDVTEILASRH